MNPRPLDPNPSFSSPSILDRNDPNFGQTSRRTWLTQFSRWTAGTALSMSLVHHLGCVAKKLPNPDDPRLELVYGRRGLSDGRFMKPRAMVIDSQDLIYIVDMTGRIQVFDTEGKFQRSWNTPSIANGKPTGLGLDRDGNIMVADTHYYRILFYSPTGTLQEDKTIGGTNGQAPGEFGFVTDAVQDSLGRFWVSEYGEFDRVQLFDSNRNFLVQFGKHGSGPLEFNRPQSIAIDENNRLWIADACNHRIQVVSCDNNRPELITVFGEQGDRPGQFHYPYGICFDHDGHLLICEFGNHRIQKLSRDGRPIAQYGSPGRDIGQLHQPWTALPDSRHRIHILDTMNHRVQRIHLT